MNTRTGDAGFSQYWILGLLSGSAILLVALWYVYGLLAPITMLAASIAMGSASYLVAVRGLYFMAGAASHTALASASLALIIANYIPANLYLTALALGVVMVYTGLILELKGVNPNVAASILLSLTGSIAVISIYYLLRLGGAMADVEALIVGDPLLVTRGELAFTLLISTVSLLAVIISYKKISYIGLDRLAVEMAGVNPRLYDLLLYTIIAVVVIGMVKILGFIMTHVLILLPGATSILVSAGVKRGLANSVAISMVAAATGLTLSFITGLAPAGITGLILVGIYVYSRMIHGG